MVWTHKSVVLNPHYARMGLYGSDYWTYTLPRRVGSSTADALTTRLRPVCGDTAHTLGLVDSVLADTRADFTTAVRLHAAKLASDKAALSHVLAAKADRLHAGGGLAAMDAARTKEGITAKDNVRNPEFHARRSAFVHKTAPRTTPSHLPGQTTRSGRVLNGKQLATSKMKQLKERVAALKTGGHDTPKLAVLLVGDRPDSHKYVQHKVKACDRVGIDSVLDVVETTPTVTPATLTDELVARVRALNTDDSVTGIIVQLPLPEGVDTKAVLAEISTHKDVDGFGAEHLGALAGGVPKAPPHHRW